MCILEVQEPKTILHHASISAYKDKHIRATIGGGVGWTFGTVVQLPTEFVCLFPILECQGLSPSSSYIAHPERE